MPEGLNERQPPVILSEQSRLEAQLATYLERPYDDLCALPETGVVEWDGPEGPQSAFLSRDVLEDGRVRVVLQSCGTSCCAGSMRAVGMVMDREGRASPASPELMYEFTLE